VGLSVLDEYSTPPNTAFYRPIGLSAAAGRQNYGYLRVEKARLRELPGWKEWDVTASLAANLGDRSRIGVLDAGRRIGNRFYAYLHGQTPGGNRTRSQFGVIPYSALISIGVTFQM
jgi:hypothetical protein